MANPVRPAEARLILLPGQLFFDALDHSLQIGWLCQKGKAIDDTIVFRHTPFAHRRREKQNWRSAQSLIRPESRCDIATEDSWHHHVENYQVRLKVLSGGQCLFRPVFDAHFVRVRVFEV